jgi:hypothetical protein
VTRVKGGGISLELEKPADISMVKVGNREQGIGNREQGTGKWRGVYQTNDAHAPIPAALRALTYRWVKLQTGGRVSPRAVNCKRRVPVK